jgi:biofilm PGA synthesis N-glycosyltransferase PgaC
LYTLLLICCCIIFYTYLGYGLLLYLLVLLKRLLRRENQGNFNTDLPAISLLIPAYNEASCIEQKIRNCLELVYPPDRLHIIIITDGSTDDTPAIVSRYPEIQLLHQQPRAGKASAINRAMQSVTTPVVVFSDANTCLNRFALQQIAAHYGDEKVGAVAGEKRVVDSMQDAEPTEGMYWRYESKLKSLESSFYSVMGAAGELFSIRTDLFEPIPADTLLDDLEISLRISCRDTGSGMSPALMQQNCPRRAHAKS